MERHTLALAGLLVTALLAGCPNDRELGVDLQTVFVPGIEFDQVEVTLDGAPAATLGVRDTDSFARPRRVLERGNVPSGMRTIRVSLLNRGTPLAARRVQLAFDRSRVVAITITRDCREVSCPSSGATECVGRTCVPPECSRLGEIECPTPVCSRDSECAASVECSEGVCVDGVCLDLPRAGGCEAGSVCVPDRGCVPRATVPDAGPLDAGAADASGRVDAAPTCSLSEVCGNLADDDCDGATDCSDTECSSGPSCASCVGVTCAACQTCDASTGSCVPVDGVPCGGGTCWAGACCVGCWDGASCVSGSDDDARCGRGGEVCFDCGPCSSCGAAGACQVPPGGTGNPCPGGVCTTDGACCTTCFVSDEMGTSTCLTAPGPECGVGSGGAYCTGCPACQTCNADGLCDPESDRGSTGIVRGCPGGGGCVSGTCCLGCNDGGACAAGTETGACGIEGENCNPSCPCTPTGICSFPAGMGTCTEPYRVTGPTVIPVDLCGREDTVTASCQPTNNQDFVIQNDSGVNLQIRTNDPLGMGWTFLMDGTCEGWACGRNFDSILPGRRMAVHQWTSGCGVVVITLR